MRLFKPVTCLTILLVWLKLRMKISGWHDVRYLYQCDGDCSRCVKCWASCDVNMKPSADVKVIGLVQLSIWTLVLYMPFPSKIQSTYCRLPLYYSMLFECTHICYIKNKWNHLPLKSHLPLHAPQKTCVVVHICKLKHTHQCVSRLQEYWSLSAPHSTAARNRVACTMLNWVLFKPAAVSHTCYSCVHHSLCPTSKLHQSDNLLHQQSELLWSPASVSPQSVSLCSSGPHRALCSSQNLSHTCHSRADAATVQVASCTELLFAIICRSRSQSCTHPCCVQHHRRQRRAYLSHNQSCSLEYYMAWAAAAICYMRPSSHSWIHTCQRHPHSCHHSH